MRTALVHDYLTQRGGAERVALSLARAFPHAPLHTSLYEPETTFPAFADVDVRPMMLNRLGPFRRNHRAALPLLAPAFSRLRLDADVVVCSSSGWAHGAQVTGRKIVYCHTPARWLYQADRYLRGRGVPARILGRGLRRPLVAWDKRAAASADRYIANSTAVAQRIAALYGIEAEVLPPPPALARQGAARPVPGVRQGDVLCVSRLLPYKNVDSVIRAFEVLRDERLVVAGVGPEESTLRRLAPSNVIFAGGVDDDQLRWLYATTDLLVAASHEDFGLTPLEAGTFGKPSVVLRWGGFLDTVRDGETGLFFEKPEPRAIAEAVHAARRHAWDGDAICRHAEAFSEARFISAIRTMAGDSA